MGPERRRGRPARRAPRRPPASPARRPPRRGPRRHRAAWRRTRGPGAGRAGRRAGTGPQPRCAGGPAPAGATGTASAPTRAARSRPAPRPRRPRHPTPARTSSSGRRRALEHRAGVGTAEQRLGGRLRCRTPQPPVAEQRVDPVAGGGERRGHALEAPQRVQGGRGGRGHGRNATHRVTSTVMSQRRPRPRPLLRRGGRRLRPRPADVPPRGGRVADRRGAGAGARARRGHRQAHRAAGRPRPRRARHGPGRRDAGQALRATAGGPHLAGVRGGDPGRRPVLRRGGLRAGLPLVRPRPGAARDRPSPQARRPAVAGLEPARRAGPVGAPAGHDHRHPGAAPRAGGGAGGLGAVRRASRRRSSASASTIDQHTIKDLVLSRSNVATLPPDQREAKLAEVVAFYGEYGRGMDGMQLPYAARCFRTRVLDRPASYTGTTETSAIPEDPHPDLGRRGDRHAAHRLPVAAEKKKKKKKKKKGTQPGRALRHQPGHSRVRTDHVGHDARTRAGVTQPVGEVAVGQQVGRHRALGSDHVAGTGPGSPEGGDRDRPAPQPGEVVTGAAEVAPRQRVSDPAATITTGWPGTAPARSRRSTWASASRRCGPSAGPSTTGPAPARPRQAGRA